MAEDGRQPSRSVATGLGTIKVQLRRAKLDAPRGSTDDSRFKRLHTGPYDEKKVKLALAHVADLMEKHEVEPVNETWNLKLHPQEVRRPFHCFLFKHNSKKVLTALGIIRRKGRERECKDTGTCTWLTTVRVIDAPPLGSEKNPIVL